VAFADALKTFREGSGVSQYALSKTADVAHSTISRLESGNRNPTKPMVQAICNALELNLHQTEYLYKQAGFAYHDDMTPVEDIARLVLMDSGYPAAIVDRLDTIWRASLELAQIT
jgi:transcriptional regulator with XRE-family HTH domain